jgi:hypothetical protein
MRRHAGRDRVGRNHDRMRWTARTGPHARRLTTGRDHDWMRREAWTLRRTAARPDRMSRITGPRPNTDRRTARRDWMGRVTGIGPDARRRTARCDRMRRGTRTGLVEPSNQCKSGRQL